MLTHVAEENRRRHSELRPRRVRLQCLRCGSEFTPKGGGREEEEEEEAAEGGGAARRRGAASRPQGVGEQGEEELTGYNVDTKGESDESATTLFSLFNFRFLDFLSFVFVCYVYLRESVPIDQQEKKKKLN